MTSHASAVIMERRTRIKASKQRRMCYLAAEQPKYLEGAEREADSDSGVCPPPARTSRNVGGDHASDSRGSPAAQSLCFPKSSFNTPPQYQRREHLNNPGLNLPMLEELNTRLSTHEGVLMPAVQHLHATPAVNRDLKPDRKNTMLDEHMQDQELREQDIEEVPQRSSGSMLPMDLVHHISRLNLHKASRQQPPPARMTYYDEWYAGACHRADAEHALHLVNKDGAFLVRDCSKSTNCAPFVLAVYHEKKVYNVKIHFFEHTKKYALGTGQRAIDMFDTVADIIKFHTIFPIVLVNGAPGTTKSPQNCVLTYLITSDDITKLLE